MGAGRRCLGIVAALALSLSAACAHGRSQTSRGLLPTSPPKHNSAASSDASRRAQDKIDSVRKQLELATTQPHESGNDSERPVGQIGSGSERSASTTGVVPQPAVSGGWSTIVSQTPGSPPLPAKPTPGQANEPTVSERRLNGTALRAIIVACILVVAILWLPRRIHQ